MSTALIIGGVLILLIAISILLSKAREDGYLQGYHDGFQRCQEEFLEEKEEEALWAITPEGEAVLQD